jgi:hypothetical protein
MASEVTYDSPRAAVAANPPAPSAATDPVLWIQDGAALPANVETGVNEAADNLTAFRGQQNDSRALSISQSFAAEIDALRASPRPTIQDLDPAVAMPAPLEPAQLEPIAADASDVERALAIPEIAAAISSELDATHATRTAYGTGLQNAMAYSREALLEIAPQLSALPIEHFAQGLQDLAHTDPARYNAVARILDRVGHITAALHAEEAHAAQGLETWAKQQSAQFDADVNLTRSEKDEVGKEMLAYVRELGVPEQQFFHAMQTVPALRSHAMQRVLYDAVQSRITQRKAQAAIRRPISPVPPVQRPGTTAGAGRHERNSAAIAGLSAQLNKSGDLKTAFKLLQESRKAR